MRTTFSLEEMKMSSQTPLKESRLCIDRISEKLEWGWTWLFELWWTQTFALIWGAKLDSTFLFSLVDWVKFFHQLTAGIVNQTPSGVKNFECVTNLQCCYVECLLRSPEWSSNGQSSGKFSRNHWMNKEVSLWWTGLLHLAVYTFHLHEHYTTEAIDHNFFCIFLLTFASSDKSAEGMKRPLETRRYRAPNEKGEKICLDLFILSFNFIY